MYGTPNSEQLLLTALSNGDRKATEHIYRQQYPIISGWLIKNGGDEDDVADLFQEAMVVLFGKAQDEEFRLTCSIGTYLFSISKRLWYKRLQQQQKGPSRLIENLDDEDTTGHAYEEDLDVHSEREAHYNQLNHALDQIGEPCRSLLQAYYHHDKSMQTIAADFGYTNPENAKTQKYKCLARLRKLFHTMQAK